MKNRNAINYLCLVTLITNISNWRSVLFILVLIFSTAFCYYPGSDEGQEKVLIQTMIKAIRQAKTHRFHLKAKERMENGKIHELKSKVKMQLKPRKLYLYMENGGQELLWVEGQNNGHAIINPNGFPYINLNLDPQGNLMRKDQHHSIHELGFEYLADLLEKTIKENETEFYRYTVIAGSTTWNGIDCFNVMISYPKFVYSEYTVKPGETVLSIAKAKGVSEFMLKLKNKQISDYGALQAGTKIMVPSAYAKQILLFIDKKTKFPLFQKINDDEGLFEQFEYDDFELNPVILPEEFTTSYKGYGF